MILIRYVKAYSIEFLCKGNEIGRKNYCLNANFEVHLTTPGPSICFDIALLMLPGHLIDG